MLAELTPIEETPIYKHILRLGREEGREEVLLNFIKHLTRLQGEGSINEEAFLKCVAPFRQELQELRTKAKARSNEVQTQ